jgi:hypothetical protein
MIHGGTFNKLDHFRRLCGILMVMNKNIGQVMKGQIGKTKIQVVEEPFSNAGIYVWQLESGKFFTDGEGNALNIESMRDDQSKIKELTDAAKYYGQPNGKAVFFPNVRKISDEEYSEQKDRMAQGLIPSEYDLGAMIAAKQTFDLYGSED